MPTTFIGILGIGWFDPSSVSMFATVEILAGLLTLIAILALASLGMAYSERRKREKADICLRRQLAANQALLDAIPFPIMQKDVTGAYRVLNDACQRRLGIDPTQTIGQTSLELQSHRLLPLTDGTPAGLRIQELGQDALRDGKVQRCEFGYVSSDGRQRVGLFLEFPQRILDGVTGGSVSVLLDITEYRDIELSARATEQSLKEITQRIPVVVFSVLRGSDRLHRLPFIAGNLRALFGLDLPDLMETEDVLRPWPFHDRIHAEDALAVGQMLRHAARHLGTSTLDFRAYGAEGVRWIHLVMMARRLPDKSLQWIGYFIDTTTVSAHNEALRAARDAAERASKAKADFLATMSHEIRTPMNGVIGMLELLAHTSLDAEQQELLQAVEDSAGVLMQVLNDVLDFSKLEAGNLRLDHAAFDVRTLIDNVVGIMTGPMHKKDLHIEVGMDAALAGQFVGDSVRVRQILLNLLNNASKFTDQGSVAVRLRVLGDDGDSQRLQISVIDTGIGIAEDKQSNLFTPFSQAESWTTRRYGGTGLGLAICRHLVQLMGGTIELSSRLGEGTKVAMELRLPIAERETTRPESLAGRHAIVRLRSIETTNALTAHLTALGLTVEPIPPWQKLRRGVAANLLFIDTGDRESPGLVAAQVITVDLGAAALGRIQNDDECIVLNANPLKWQAVLRVCLLAVESFHSASPNLGRPLLIASDRKKPKQALWRILVAEDHPISQSLVRRQLDLLGFSCDVVGHGAAAYEALCNSEYALLLTDCQMPLMDGYELASRWRQREEQHGRTTRLPIIAMTANALDGEIERCRAAGMDDYLSKPLQLRQLERKIGLWVPQPMLTSYEAAISRTAMRDDVFAEPVMQSVRAEMLQMLLVTSDTDLKKVENAVAIGDAQQAMQILHRILGALQLFTKHRVIAEGRVLMEALTETEANETLPKLPAYLNNLRKVLTELAPPDDI